MRFSDPLGMTADKSGRVHHLYYITTQNFYQPASVYLQEERYSISGNSEKYDTLKPFRQSFMKIGNRLICQLIK